MTSVNLEPNKHLDTSDLIRNQSKVKTLFNTNFNGGDNKQPTFLGHCLITISLVILLSTSYFSLNLYAGNKAKQWLKGQVELIPATTEINAKEAEKLRIAEQLKVVNFQINRYAEIMVFFSNHYYTSIVLTSASALLAAICLFFISKIGWEKAHNSLINVFIVACTAVIFFGDLPGNFKEEENFKAYGNLYLEHIVLRNEILSYLATGGTVWEIDSQSPNKVSTLDANEFIHHIDNKIAQLNRIPIGFDATGVNDIGAIVTRFNPTIQPSAPSQ